MRELEKWNTVDGASRFIAADLMPRGTGVILPQLAAIEPELQWVSDDRSLVTLAKILVDGAVVRERLKAIVDDEDLRKYIL